MRTRQAVQTRPQGKVGAVQQFGYRKHLRTHMSSEQSDDISKKMSASATFYCIAKITPAILPRFHDNIVTMESFERCKDSIVPSLLGLCSRMWCNFEFA